MLLIGDIYCLASSVITFLGPEADGSRYALDLIKKTGYMANVNF